MVILLSTIAIFFSVILNVVAQILLKKSVNEIALELSLFGLVSFPFKLVGVLSFWLGILFLCLDLSTWLIALKNLPLSVIYPFSAISIIFVALASRQFLGENLSALSILGIVLIVSGVSVLFTSIYVNS